LSRVAERPQWTGLTDDARHDAAIENFVKWLDARAAQIEEGRE